MCRFWLLGQCRKGIACPFSHDNAHPDSFLCPYFQQGTCKHGARCKYDHRVPEALDGRLDARPDGWSSTGVTASPCEGVGRAASERHGSLSAVVQPSAQRAPPARAPAGSALLHETRQVIADEAPICVYYAQRGGRCQFGDQCRFRHPDAAVGDASTHRSPSRGLSIKAPAPQRATVEAATGALQSLQLTGRGRAAAGSHALAIRPPPGSAWLQPGESAASVAAAQCSEAGAEATGVRAPAGLSLFDDNEELADPWSMADKPRAPKADAGAGVADEDAPVEAEPQAEAAAEMLCPAFTMTGACVAGGECPYLHGGCCPICQLNCLHPYDEGISEAHVADCAAAAKLMHDRATSAVVRLLGARSSNIACLLPQRAPPSLDLLVASFAVLFASYKCAAWHAPPAHVPASFGLPPLPDVAPHCHMCCSHVSVPCTDGAHSTSPSAVHAQTARTPTNLDAAPPHSIHIQMNAFHTLHAEGVRHLHGDSAHEGSAGRAPLRADELRSLLLPVVHPELARKGLGGQRDHARLPSVPHADALHHAIQRLAFERGAPVAFSSARMACAEAWHAQSRAARLPSHGRLCLVQEHKAQIIQGYQSALATRHCRHFDFGRGECPFGTSCFYRHEFEDGSLQDRTPDFRKAVDANGEHAVIHPINLSSFMEMQASLHNHYSWQ